MVISPTPTSPYSLIIPSGLDNNRLSKTINHAVTVTR